MRGMDIGWSALVAILFVIGVLWGVWRVAEWLLQRDKAWTDAVGEVMAATVQRRDRNQTLAIVLEQTIQTLGAHSGTMHLAADGTDQLTLAYAVNVARLDWLAAVPANDVVARLLDDSKAPTLLPANQLTIRWQALAVGNDAGVVTTPLAKEALMVLAWTTVRDAERQLAQVRGIQRYVEQVMGEYAELEARAADIQALSVSLNNYERLSRTAAHDLANKLAAAHSLLDLAADDPGLEKDTADLIKQALEQLSLSRPLVDELSDPNRNMELEALEVEDLARLAAAMVARRRCERTVSFSLDIKDELPAVLGERLAVLRVLDNLISNALKHNTQVVNLRIWLKVRAKGPHVLFEVGDDGTGIAAEALPCLFEFGFSADSTGKVKGHGLGLWSSRRLVEAMGGEIWATSEPGRRTHFYFTLPVANDSLEAFEAAIQDGFQSVHQLRSGELAANGY